MFVVSINARAVIIGPVQSAIVPLIRTPAVIVTFSTMRPIFALAERVAIIRANIFKPIRTTKNDIINGLQVLFQGGKKSSVTVRESPAWAVRVIVLAFVVPTVFIVVHVHISSLGRVWVVSKIAHVIKTANALAVHAVCVRVFVVTFPVNVLNLRWIVIATKSRRQIIPARVTPDAITAVRAANSLGITRNAKRAFVITSARPVRRLVNIAVRVRIGMVRCAQAGPSTVRVTIFLPMTFALAGRAVLIIVRVENGTAGAVPGSAPTIPTAVSVTIRTTALVRRVVRAGARAGTGHVKYVPESPAIVNAIRTAAFRKTTGSRKIFSAPLFRNSILS